MLDMSQVVIENPIINSPFCEPAKRFRFGDEGMAVGEKRKEKSAAVDAAQTFWVPAVNNDGGFGRWAFLVISDPWNAKIVIREFRTLEHFSDF